MLTKKEGDFNYFLTLLEAEDWVLDIGANILCRAALDDEFADASGKYYDNDAGRFAPPNTAAGDAAHCAAVMQGIEEILAGV